MIEDSAPLDPADAGPTGAGSAPAPVAVATRAGARRPAVVTILAILQLLTAAAYGMIFAALIVAGPDTLALLLEDAAAEGGLLGELEVATAVVGVGGLATATLAAGVLLLRMRQLGWTITMLLAGLGLMSSIFIWWTEGTTISAWLFVQVASVFYLNQRQVREAFGISRPGGRCAERRRSHRDSAGATPSEARG